MDKKRPKLLLVDDEELIRLSYSRSFADEGYKVETANSGQEAACLLREKEYDLVITDLSMPEMDGLDVLTLVKELQPEAGVILLTAYADVASAVEAIRIGADDYLLKPCEFDEMLFRVERSLDLVRLRRQEEESKKMLAARVLKRTRELEEVNTALTVLLNKREADQEALEEQVLQNIKHLVNPYLNKLKRGSLAPELRETVDILATNIAALTSQFSARFSSKYYNLSPSELQVANLIHLGRSSKEIAGIMNLSIETVHNHRKHIRKKFGISKKNVSLEEFLSLSLKKKVE